MDIANFVAVLLFVCLLAGCNSAAIYQDDSFNPPVYFGVHYVRPGETLHSIAWRYGRDYKELAAANRIGAPYKIFPDQPINLELPEGFTYRPSPPVQVSKSVPVSKSSPVAAKTPKKTTSETSAYKKKQSEKPVRQEVVSGTVKWHWPSSGPMIEPYSTTGRVNKGIDLGGATGDPVYAAASGEVVYAGSGLLGYGQLVIINHNEQFLSAYAHNHRILVQEGQAVKAGQKIAVIG